MVEQVPAPEQPTPSGTERKVLAWAEAVGTPEKASEKVGEKAGEASAPAVPVAAPATQPVPSPAAAAAPASVPAVRYTTPTALAQAVLGLRKTGNPTDSDLFALAVSLKTLRGAPADDLSLERAETELAQTR